MTDRPSGGTLKSSVEKRQYKLQTEFAVQKGVISAAKSRAPDPITSLAHRGHIWTQRLTILESIIAGSLQRRMGSALCGNFDTFGELAETVETFRTIWRYSRDEEVPWC